MRLQRKDLVAAAGEGMRFKAMQTGREVFPKTATYLLCLLDVQVPEIESAVD